MNLGVLCVYKTYINMAHSSRNRLERIIHGEILFRIIFYKISFQFVNVNMYNTTIQRICDEKASTVLLA